MSHELSHELDAVIRCAAASRTRAAAAVEDPLRRAGLCVKLSSGKTDLGRYASARWILPVLTFDYVTEYVERGKLLDLLTSARLISDVETGSHTVIPVFLSSPDEISIPAALRMLSGVQVSGNDYPGEDEEQVRRLVRALRSRQ